MTVTADFVKRIKRTWTQHAPHLWWGDRLDARFVVADAVRSLDGVRVLDLGCNAGVMLSEVPSTNDRFGLDRSNEAILLARKLNPSLLLVIADMLALPFPDASFDVVIFCGMLELPPRERKAKAVREMARVLRPGGKLYLTTPNRRYLRYRYRRAPSTVTYEELCSLLSPHFDSEIKGFNPLPPFPCFLPNRFLAHIPGIWRILVALMERDIGTRSSCFFLVKAVKRPDESTVSRKTLNHAKVGTLFDGHGTGAITVRRAPSRLRSACGLEAVRTSFIS